YQSQSSTTTLSSLSKRSIIRSSFLLTPPPPRSTLFPYTTLFRSCSSIWLQKGCRVGRVSPVFQLGIQPELLSPAILNRSMPRTPDRKSTRLNSSHSQISYAVFCLKKTTRLHPLEMRLREGLVFKE